LAWPTPVANCCLLLLDSPAVYVYVYVYGLANKTTSVGFRLAEDVALCKPVQKVTNKQMEESSNLNVMLRENMSKSAICFM